jgi:hypothetical protein
MATLGIPAGLSEHFISGEVFASIAGPSEQLVEGAGKSGPLDVPF